MGTAAFLSVHVDANIIIVVCYATAWYLVLPAATLILGYHVVVESEDDLEVLKDCLALLILLDANNILQFLLSPSAPRFNITLPSKQLRMLRHSQRRFILRAGILSLITGIISLIAWFMTVTLIPIATHMDLITVALLTCLSMWSTHSTRQNNNGLEAKQIKGMKELERCNSLENIDELLWSEKVAEKSETSDG